MTIVVVSTAFNPPAKARKLCEASVRAQTVKAKHFYVDAGSPLTSLDCEAGAPCLANLTRMIKAWPPDTIIVWLDGDDWLAHPGVLARVQERYDVGAEVTYGSYITADGTKGIARPFQHNVFGEVEWRRHQWVFTHLKTFRAGLFQRINVERDLKVNGEWITSACDVAVMFPILEMAGPDRVSFIAETLCVYNFRNSGQVKDPEHRRNEMAFEAYVRGLEPYKPC